MKKAIIWILLIPMVGTFDLAWSINVADYLIENDIGQYSPSYTGDCPKGSGIVAGAGHFRKDHTDYACDIRYYNETLDLGVEVQVTQHAGSDSDKWLLHEVDAEFRNYYGIPDLSYVVKTIDGNTIFAFGSGGWDYRWLSGNKVIMIEYHDAQMKKPQPLEVVQAYLAKHPSTLPTITLQELRSADSKTKWIKDEMDRRLWLCEKWFLQLQMGKVGLDETLDTVVKCLAVFLNYREKYFGVKAADEGRALLGYLNAKDGTSIKSKLSSYKTWWSVNKGKSISVP